MKRTSVVAALIWNDNDEFLICQRPDNKARASLWEFVGGKLEEGETDFDALRRECKEELDILVKPIDLFQSVEHNYPDIDILLNLYNCTIESGEPKLLEHKDLKWIKKDEIDNYEFCPADYEILDNLKKL